MPANNELAFRVKLDGAGQVQADLKAIEKAVKDTGQAAGAAAQGVAAAQKQVDQYGMSAKQTAAALRQVPAQFTDIVTGLASGQSPMTVLLQQGGQLKDMFGGVGNAARALGGYVASLIGPFTLAAAAAAALGYAFLKGSEEAQEFARTLINTGNAAGTSVGELQDLAEAVSASTGATRGAASDVLNGIAGSGTIAADLLGKVAEAAIALERAGGQAAEKTVQQFAALGKEPVEASKKLDETTHYLTATVLEQVQALVEQGRAAEAATVAQIAYHDALTQRIPALANQLGTLETVWRNIKTEAGKAWDAMLSVGREDTTAQKLKAAQDRVAAGEPGAKGEVAVWQAKLDAEKQTVALQEQANVKRKAELAWLKDGEQFRSKQQKMEAEIAAAREIGVKAGKTDLEVQKRIGEIRDKYAEKEKAPRAARAPKADPLDAELERMRAEMRAQDAGLSSSTLKSIETLTTALKRGKVEAAEYEKLLGMLLDKDSVLKAGQLRDEQSRRAQEAMAGSVENLRNAYGRQIEASGERDMPQAQRELARSLRQVSEEADRARESLSQKAATLRVDDLPALDAYRQAIIEVSQAEEEQIAWVRQNADEQERLNALWETGAQRALQKYVESTTSVADEVESAFTRAFRGMEDALMDFLTTGKANFADFAKQLIADMARIELRALLTKNAGSGSSEGGGGLGGIVGGILGGIKSIFGFGASSPLPGSLGAAGGLPLPSFAAGGAFGPDGPIHAFAGGGVVSRPTLFRFALGGASARGLMGEAGPEAILPLGRDRSGRLGVRSPGGSAPQITVHVSGAGATLADIRQAAGHGARQALGLMARAQRYG